MFPVAKCEKRGSHRQESSIQYLRLWCLLAGVQFFFFSLDGILIYVFVFPSPPPHAFHMLLFPLNGKLVNRMFSTCSIFFLCVLLAFCFPREKNSKWWNMEFSARADDCSLDELLYGQRQKQFARSNWFLFWVKLC